MLQCTKVGWKITCVSLGEFLGPMQEMGMNFKHQGTVDCRQNIEIPGFLNSSKSKTRLKFMKLGMLSWSGINMSWYKFCPIWGRFGHHASHKPELLTTSMMVFGREHPSFVDETISIASYCFQFFFSCQHRTKGVLCEFLWLFGVRLDIFIH